MKEIGGYFGLEQLTDRPYYPELQAVNNGRSALLYILRARNVRKLYIPRFLCDSVSRMCRQNGFDFEYYSIGADFLPVFDRKLPEGEYLYLVNYYGQISNDRLRSLREQYGNVIFDNVQAFFQRPVSGIDTVYSCRKFFGVPDGGYAATDAVLPEELEIDVSRDRMKHILGRFEGCASDYYGDFKENDRSFTHTPLRRMSALTRNLLGAIDYEAVCRRRNENYACLSDLLGRCNGLVFQAPEGPYCYPFYCKDGMVIKAGLAKRKIYVPTLWPNVLELEGTVEKDLAENILPLPCDQRYGPEDMREMASALLEIMDRLSREEMPTEE